MLRFLVRNGEASGRTAESRDAPIRIGRSDGNELVVDEWHVSGEHASAVPSDWGFVLRDHHSTNGTRVQRAEDVLELADPPCRELVLEDGDVVLLGDPEQAVAIEVSLDEANDARIVSMRRVDELAEAEALVESDGELLRRVYEAQKAIAAAVDVDEVVDAVATQVFAFLPRATHVTAALRQADELPGEAPGAASRGDGSEAGGRRSGGVSSPGRYVPVGTRVRDGSPPGEQVPVTRSVFRKVIDERAAVLAADAPREVGETASLMAARIRSTIGVPLWRGDAILGVLQVDNRGASGLFREPDLDVLAVLAGSASHAFERARLVQRLRVAEEQQRSENVYLKRRAEHQRFDGIVGESASMGRLLDQVRKVVDTRVTVLIEGETGTGKELVASAVHYWSKRRDKLFVAQNCAAMPENLLESELFGHKKGAFTGATEDKKGLFELADQGTLFLDEVGEMPLSLQAKLLRVLQEGEVRPVGSNVTRRVDTRIVAATNRDLEREVAEGRFREDLFYRLRVFPLQVPALRERREDVPLLARHFLERYAREFGRAVGGFSQRAMELLQAYDWPGNVRELENEVQRLVIQAEEGGFVQPEDVSPRVRKAGGLLDQVQPKKGTLKEVMEQVEKTYLLRALEEHGNNKSATAKTLGITREGLHKKLKNFGLS